MDEEMPSVSEGAMKAETDVGPPVLESQSEDSGSEESDTHGQDNAQKDSNLNITAPVLSIMKVPDVDPENALRSPPKLIPAIAAKSKGEESKTPAKPLSGSMKNTPASLSIIEAPTASVGKSTRSTRSSIDPSFAAKQRNFLNKVHNALSSTHYNDMDDTSGESDHEMVVEKEVSDDKSPEYVPGLEEIPKKLLNGIKRRREEALNKSKVSPGTAQEHTIITDPINEVTSEPSPKKRTSMTAPDGKLRDAYCWYCHREETELFCASCPRGFHNRCLRKPLSANPEEEWVCIECTTILRAENQETRSKALKMHSLDQLCKLLLYAVNRMKSCVGAEVFENPVDLEQFPSYKEHIINPMHLSLLEKNIKKRMYGSTEAFIGDSMWILHNCIIFNSFNSKLTSIAKNILKLCKQEMAEVENCPDCYNFAYTNDENFFIKVCQKPHLLVWAKLKGFPYWPAKVIRSNTDSVDVRFFGAHDRAWVPARDCYLYSEENPNFNTPGKVTPTNVQQKKRSSKNNLDTCIEEVKLHITLLKKRFSTFQYAPFKTHVHIKKLDDHLKFMLPDLDANSSNISGSATKTPLIRRGSLELEPGVSCPPVKRMKADFNVVHVVDPNSPKENGSGKESPALKKAALKEGLDSVAKPVVSPSGSSSTSEHSADVCKENGASTPKANGTAVQSKTIGISKTVSLHVVTPGKSNTFILPLSSSQTTSLAELRLKKKDVRKIGLVDRLQEKLNTMLKNRSPSPNDDDDDEACVKEEEPTNDAENNDEDCGNVSKDSVSSDNAAGSDDENAVMKEAVKNILDSFKMIEKQPKVILTKLTLDDKNNPIENSRTMPVKEECLSSEDEKDTDTSSTKCSSDKVKQIVPEKRIVSDPVKPTSKKDSSKKSAIDATPGPASQSKPPKEVAASIIPESLKSNVKSGELNIELGAPPKALPIVFNRTSGKYVNKKKNKTEAVSVTLVASNKNEEPSGSEPKGLLNVSQSAEETPDVVPQRNQGFPFKPIKLPFVERSVSILPQKEEDVKMPVNIAPKPLPVGQNEGKEIPASSNNVKIIKSVKIPSRTSNSLPAKPLLSNNVTVYLEPSGQQNLENSENPLVIISPPESDSSPITSSNISKTKKADAANKLENQKSQTKSPPRLASPSVVCTPVRPQTKSSSTSVLKPKVSSPTNKGTAETSDTGENTSASSQIMVALGSTKSSNAEAPTSSNVSNSVVKSPTFVTIAGGTGIRILPKSMPIVLRTPNSTPTNSPTSVPAQISASAVPPPVALVSCMEPATALTLDNTVAITPRISPLVTSVSSAAVPPLMSSLQGKESVLKKPPHYNMIPSLKAAPISLRDLRREMPPLSSASVSSQKSAAASTTTSAGCRLISQTTPSGSYLSVSENFPSVCVSEKPVSSQLKGQAQKMTQVFLECMKDFLGGMGSSGSLEAQVRSLQHDMELMQWRHQQELTELKHNTELAIAEIKDRAKIECQRAVYLAVLNNAKDREAAIAAAVSAAKEKQWCAFCKKEAMFYCCWNTSYCDYQCQQNHWRVHSLTCTQNSPSSAEIQQSSSGDSQQPASTGRITVKSKEVLSPPHLKKQGTPSKIG